MHAFLYESQRYTADSERIVSYVSFNSSSGYTVTLGRPSASLELCYGAPRVDVYTVTIVGLQGACSLPAAIRQNWASSLEPLRTRRFPISY